MQTQLTIAQNAFYPIVFVDTWQCKFDDHDNVQLLQYVCIPVTEIPKNRFLFQEKV